MIQYNTILPASGDAIRIGGLPKFLLPLSQGSLLKILINKCQNLANNNIFIIGLKTQTMSETILKLYRIVHQTITFFAMPDTYFLGNHFNRMLEILEKSNADICLGVWKIRPEQKGRLGQCKFNDQFLLKDIIDKDITCEYEWGWGIAVWKPVLWKYINPKDPQVGYAF